MRSRTLLSLAITFFALSLPARIHASAPQYRVLDLGSFGPFANDVFGINASGQVVGNALVPRNGMPPNPLQTSVQHAIRWTGTVAEELGPLDTASGWGYSINDFGQIAGASGPTLAQGQAVRWTGTTAEFLPSLGGPSVGVGINNSGQIAGYFGTLGPLVASPASYAVRWTGAVAEALETPDGLHSAAFAINEVGQVAGSLFDRRISGQTSSQAVRWTGTTLETLGTLGGTRSGASGINAAGQVTGGAYLPGDSVMHAVRWTGTTPVDLGTLGGTFSVGYAINGSGDVTGISLDAGGFNFVPFLYTDGVMYDLKSLLLPDSGVTDLTLGNPCNNLNDLGQIAAYGTIGGQRHVLLLTPTPEPATTVLMLGGGLLLGLRRR